MEYQDIINFHGHSCPGLAIGYRMSNAAMASLEAVRACDEELVAIVENDACGVDALQCVTGCTFGKGNLVFRDYGKQVYTFYSRSTRKGVRVVYHRERIPAELHGDRIRLAEYILDAPDEAILSVTPVVVGALEPARIRNSVICPVCGEAVMETRLRELNGQMACIPCAHGNSMVAAAD